MLDITLLVILTLGFFIGLRRGFIMELLHLTGFIIAYFAANIYYADLAPKLKLWIPYPNFGDNATLKVLTNSSNMEDAFYRALAYIIIFFAVKLVLRIIGTMLNFIAHLPVLRQLNVWAGGILGFCEVYLVAFILLYVAALIPMEAIQTALQHSILAGAIIQHTPFLSQQIKQMWMEYGSASTALTFL